MYQFVEKYKNKSGSKESENRYIQKHLLSFEIYLNTPDEVGEEELVTEIYIPIDNK